MPRRALLTAALALAAAGAGGCHGHAVSYVYVKVLAPPVLDGVTDLRTTLTNDGQVAANDFTAPMAKDGGVGTISFPTSLTIELPSGRGGECSLEVDATGSAGVLIASGKATFTAGTNVTQVNVMLYYPVPPADAGVDMTPASDMAASDAADGAGATDAGFSEIHDGASDGAVDAASGERGGGAG